MSGMLHETALLAEPIAGTGAVPAPVVDIVTLADDARVLFRHDLRQDGAPDIEVVSALTVCTGDAQQLHQLLVTLLSVALGHHNADRTRAEIALRPDAGGLYLEMSVSGRFADGEFGCEADGPTPGIGISLCRRICRALGGTLVVEPAQGRLRALLAVAPADAAGIAAPAPRLPHVLMAEDNPTNQFVLARILQKIGMTFETVGNGGEALSAWEVRHYDAVLMDIEMPVLDGYETSRVLRQRETDAARPRTPIIALSADAWPASREKARLAGMDDFLTKPVAIEKLRQAIFAALPAYFASPCFSQNA